MKKHIVIIVATLMGVLLSACSTPAQVEASPPLPTQTQITETVTTAAAKLITPSEAYASMDEAVLLDVRTAEEFAEKHIPGSYLIPVEELAKRAAAELPKDIALYVYCRTGRRSALAVEELSKQGFTNVFDLGGIADWPYETEQGAFEKWDLNSVDTACADYVTGVEILNDLESIPDDEFVELPDLCGTSDDCE